LKTLRKWQNWLNPQHGSKLCIAITCHPLGKQRIFFPFALGLKGLGKETKQAGSYMIMSIVGGAFIPPLMGLLADISVTSMAFVLPCVSFMVVFWYARWGHKISRG
jgi:fucose permease